MALTRHSGCGEQGRGSFQGFSSDPDKAERTFRNARRVDSAARFVSLEPQEDKVGDGRGGFVPREADPETRPVWAGPAPVLSGPLRSSPVLSRDGRTGRLGQDGRLSYNLRATQEFCRWTGPPEHERVDSKGQLPDPLPDAPRKGVTPDKATLCRGGSF